MRRRTGEEIAAHAERIYDRLTAVDYLYALKRAGLPAELVEEARPDTAAAARARTALRCATAFALEYDHLYDLLDGDWSAIGSPAAIIEDAVLRLRDA